MLTVEAGVTKCGNTPPVQYGCMGRDGCIRWLCAPSERQETATLGGIQLKWGVLTMWLAAWWWLRALGSTFTHGTSVSPVVR